MWKRRIFVAMVLMMAMVIGYAQPVVGSEGINPNQTWNLVWSDEFNDGNGCPVNTAKWSFDIGDGSDRGIPGWGNNELEYYTDRLANCYQDNGSLVIRAQQEDYMGKQYTSARLVSKNKADFTYGRFEIRAKLPYGQGIWPAIWALPTGNAYGGWPASGELDIMEYLGQNPYKIYGTAHWGNPYQMSGGNYTSTTGRFSDDFHVFAMEWEPEQIRWYVDGVQYHFLDMNKPFDQPFHLLLNVAVGGNWPGSPDYTTGFPQAMTVDYVRVYQRSAGESLAVVQKTLNDFIREKQLQYVSRSYGTWGYQCFTWVDLDYFKQDLADIKTEIRGDARLTSIAARIKARSWSDQQTLYASASKIYTPTWAQMGYIDSQGNGQTDAGQAAERMIGEAIVSMIKTM